MKYNKAIDKENIKTYAKNGLTASNIDRHKCVLCEKSVSIDCSMSNKGSKLICNTCAREKFKSLKNAIEWVYSKEVISNG